jgi:UDP-N-acetylmuramoylalanine--D-glutamate ligase
MFRIAPHCKNLALVAAFWTAMGGAPEALLQAANQGKLAPHRLRLEATWEGVNFWNDSKATNFHAALAALDALEGPIFWIGGGQSKGGDLAAFAGAIANRVEAAFLYGAVGEEFGIHLSKSLERVEVCGRLEYAISSATGAARLAAPAQVLFSPGFASFDQFSSYAARGKCFISEVLSLMHLDSRD